MPKRQRRSSAEIVKINSDGTAVLEYCGKQYHWNIPEDVELRKITDTSQFDIVVIHNVEKRAMIEIVYVRSEESYLRQEINPITHKNVEEWVVDE